MVFKSRNSLVQSIIKYYILCFGLIFSSYILVLSTTLLLNIHVILAKICIDGLLGIYKLPNSTSLGILQKQG